MKTASVHDILAKQEYWGQDISFLAEDVERYYDIMERDGMAAAYKAVLGES